MIRSESFWRAAENLPLLIMLAQILDLCKSINPPKVHKRMYTIGNDSCYLVIFIVAWRVIYLPESGIWGEIISIQQVLTHFLGSLTWALCCGSHRFVAGKTPGSDPPIQPQVPVQRSKGGQLGCGWQRRLLKRGGAEADSGTGKGGEGEGRGGKGNRG